MTYTLGKHDSIKSESDWGGRGDTQPKVQSGSGHQKKSEMRNSIQSEGAKCVVELDTNQLQRKEWHTCWSTDVMGSDHKTNSKGKINAPSEGVKQAWWGSDNETNHRGQDNIHTEGAEQAQWMDQITNQLWREERHTAWRWRARAIWSDHRTNCKGMAYLLKVQSEHNEVRSQRQL